ncbi:MAG TPA: hypothetical protein VE397_05680 [Stellaceae bacterium]|nr:hypothetical protein [Stellaceae bacterium]
MVVRFIVFGLRGVPPEYLAGGLLLVVLLVLLMALLALRDARREASKRGDAGFTPSFVAPAKAEIRREAAPAGRRPRPGGLTPPADARLDGAMPPKNNPLSLNPLQLRTLTLLQALARLPGHSRPAEEPGAMLVASLPQAHGDHFHLGDAVVLTRDASGLGNEAVWRALERKGLIRSLFPDAAVLTPAGLAYDTGLADALLHRGNH